MLKLGSAQQVIIEDGIGVSLLVEAVSSGLSRVLQVYPFVDTGQCFSARKGQ